ncbi:hypothetical protein BJY59DRAFT_296140 [Rhodotorula toruloides]
MCVEWVEAGSPGGLTGALGVWRRGWRLGGVGRVEDVFFAPPLGSRESFGLVKWFGCTMKMHGLHDARIAANRHRAPELDASRISLFRLPTMPMPLAIRFNVVGCNSCPRASHTRSDGVGLTSLRRSDLAVAFARLGGELAATLSLWILSLSDYSTRHSAIQAGFDSYRRLTPLPDSAASTFAREDWMGGERLAARVGIAGARRTMLGQSRSAEQDEERDWQGSMGGQTSAVVLSQSFCADLQSVSEARQLYGLTM